MRYDHKCLFLLTGVLLILSAPAIVPAQGWMEYPYSSCPKDTAATWRRGYLEGYTQSPSIAQGQTVEFKVSTLAAYIPQGQVTTVQCAMKIYRAVGRTLSDDILMATPSNFSATFYPLYDSVGQPIFPGDRSRFPRDYRTGCNWTTATAYQIPSTWPSGFYYAKLFLPGHEQDSVGYIPFVVRAANPGSTSRTLCVIAWNTYQAYNWWGGGSLYYYTGVFGSEDSSVGTPSIPVIRTVSFRRPFGVQWIPFGDPPNCGWLLSANQLGQFDNIYNNPIVRMERFFVSWAHEARDTMEFCVDADVNANADGFLNHYRFVFFPGHSEYWSLPQRQNIEGNPQHTDFKNNGGNIAFFGANNCYWKVDYFPSVTNNPDSMYCDKDWPETVRGRYLWRRQVDPTSGDTLHEARFIGAEFMGTNAPLGNYANVAKRADHWIFRTTGLANEDTFGIGGTSQDLLPLAGAEVDRFIATRSPSNTEVLARKFIRRLTDPNEVHYGEVPGDSIYSDCTFYEDTTTNSRVFAGGGLGWPGCLFGQDSMRMRTITQNILDHFSGKKYIGKVYSRPPNYVLEWNQNIELDGDVTVLPGALLRVISSTVTIDSTFQVNGTLEIIGNVTFTGLGQVVIGPTGGILLTSGSTLKIKTEVTAADSVIISIPSTTALRLDSLAKLYFGIRSGINVSGTLVAQGTAVNPVLLTRSNCNNDYWSGITLNESASATLNHCNILHAQVGVSGNSVQPSISHCTFDSCKIGMSLFQSGGETTGSTFTHNNIKGIIIDGGDADVAPLITDNTFSSNTIGVYVTNSSPVLERNTVADNTTYGVWCDDGGNPFIGRNEPDSPGNNIFESNGDANLLADNHSFPFVGFKEDEYSTTYGGYNSFGPEKHEYDVWVKNESGVMARQNYWSENPPDETSSFRQDSHGWIDWEFPLESSGNRPSAAKPTFMNIKEQPLEGPSPFLSGGIANAAFRTAMLYRSQKKYVQAISLLKQFLSENPSATLAPTAFIILQQIVSDYARFARTPSLRTVFAAYRDSLLATTVYDRLKRVLLNCKKNDLMQRKAWSQAMGVAEQISNQYPNTPLDLHALFATVTANLFGLGNRQSAAQQYALMQQRFPESDLTAVARLLLDVASSNAAPLSPAANKATLSSSEVAQQPTEFALHQNYPNPFNPSTTIRYDLPVDAPVTLKAYDILGKELMTLVNEDQRAGYHSTVFDASRFASGVYLYQVKAGGFVQTKKLLLLR